MKLNVIEFPSSMFTWSNEGRSACAEASDMGNRHLQRLYDDACDVGFKMKSEKTGEVVTFVMASPFYHGEGEDKELAGWHYIPTSESFRNVPNCQNMEVTVFND